MTAKEKKLYNVKWIKLCQFMGWDAARQAEELATQRVRRVVREIDGELFTTEHFYHWNIEHGKVMDKANGY